MPAQEVGEAFVAIRAIATGFREQASAEVNQALASVRERATVPIRAQMETTSANRVQQSFQPVISGAQRMGTETEHAYRRTEGASHHAYETIRTTHDGIRARFGETLRAASLMGGGVALAYGVFSQGRQAITATNELAHATMQLRAATGLDAQQASAWVAIAHSRGVESSSLQTSFNALARVTSTATDAFRTSTGTLSAAGAAFHNLGISQQELQSVQGNMPAQLNLIADGFERMGPGVDRTRIAQQLFGRSYSQILPILADGKKGLQDNIDTATEYGATLSGPTLEGMHRLRAEQQQLSLEMLGMRVRIASALEPALLDLAGVALHVGHVFLNVVTGGIHAARNALHEFMGTQIGQGLQTIIGNAGRFASQIRDRFVHDLTRPVSFSHLFDNFERDLTTWLPRAARNFWAQLNSDLFAAGQNTKPVEVRIHMHARGEMTRDFAGAGIFPGMDWASLGKQFGTQIFDGVMTAFQAAATTGNRIVSIASALMTRFVDWIVSGGGAAKILSGALQVANALVSTIFDPAFWIANWQPLLSLAFIFFSDGFGALGRSILTRIGEIFGPRLGGVLSRYVPEAVRTFASYLRRLPELAGEQILRLGVWVGDHLPGTLRRVSDAIFTWAAGLPRGIIGQITRLPSMIGNLFGRIRGFIGNALDVGFFGNLLLRAIEGIGRLVALGSLRDIGVQIVQGIWSGITGAWGWFIGRVEHEFHSFIHAVESLLGIASPSSVAAEWGRDIVLGIVQGLEGLPIIGRVFTVAFHGVEIAVRTALSYIRGVFNAEIGWVRAWANLIGDLIHGRWGNIMHDLDRIVQAGIRLVNAVLGGLPGFVLRLAGRVAPAAIHVGERLLNGVISRVRQLPGQVVHFLERVGTSFIDSYAMLGRDALHLGERLLHGVISNVRKIPGQVGTWIQHIGRTIAGLGGWLLREGARIGSEILHGVINGIKSLPGAVGGALKDLASGALHDVGGFLGIGSPSRRFRDEVGKPINDGIVRGLDPLHDDLRDAIIPVTNRILDMGHDQGQSGGRTMGTGITTGIRSGLNPLQSMLTHSIVTASNGALAAAKRALGIHSPSSVYAEQIGRPLADGIVHGMGGLEKALSDRIIKAAQAAQAAAGGFGPGVTPGGTAATGANQALGLQMMLAHGWPQSQWGALQALWNRESGWNQFAKNPSSGAYGIPQSLPASKMASAGSDWMTNAATQIRWGLDYIAGRYGSPGGAWAHENQYGWYHQGGVVPGAPTQNVPIVARGGEVVFTPEQMKALSGRSVNIGRIEINNPGTGADAARELLNELARRVG